MKSSKKLISLFLVIIMAFGMSFTVSATTLPRSLSNHSAIAGSALSLKFRPLLSAPEYTLQKKVNAMFGKDPDIVVTNLTGSGKSCKFDVNVKNVKKAAAIKAILKSPVSYGNTLITINVNGPDGKTVEQSNLDAATTLNNAFSGNPIFQSVQTASFYSLYCVFSKPVIQFFNDDLSTYNGYYSAITSDVARNILATTVSGTDINYCISIN